jgi:hypothetical protein
MVEWMEARHRIQLRQYLDERTHRVQAEAHPFISSARASVDDVILLSDVCISSLRTFRRELQRDNWRVLRVREGARVMCELLEEESRCWSLRQAARLTNRDKQRLAASHLSARFYHLAAISKQRPHCPSPVSHDVMRPHHCDMTHRELCTRSVTVWTSGDVVYDVLSLTKII